MLFIMDVFYYYGIILKPNLTNLTLRTKNIKFFSKRAGIKNRILIFTDYIVTVLHGIHNILETL